MVYEVIWSCREDAYIVRPICGFSTVKPHFIGSYKECTDYIQNHTRSK